MFPLYNKLIGTRKSSSPDNHVVLCGQQW